MSPSYSRALIAHGQVADDNTTRTRPSRARDQSAEPVLWRKRHGHRARPVGLSHRGDCQGWQDVQAGDQARLPGARAAGRRECLMLSRALFATLSSCLDRETGEIRMKTATLEKFIGQLDGMIAALQQAVVLGGRTKKEREACELLKDAR